VQVDKPTQLAQAGKREPRRRRHGQCGRVDLGHPSRQQQLAALGQFDDKMCVPMVKETPNDCEAYAGLRVMRIVDNDLIRLLLGSMSCVRREQCRKLNCIS